MQVDMLKKILSSKIIQIFTFISILTYIISHIIILFDDNLNNTLTSIKFLIVYLIQSTIFISAFIIFKTKEPILEQLAIYKFNIFKSGLYIIGGFISYFIIFQIFFIFEMVF